MGLERKVGERTEANPRFEALRKGGVGRWLEFLEGEIVKERSLPEITAAEAEALAKKFGEVVDWKAISFPPLAPERKTETPINRAREEGLERGVRGPRGVF